MHELDAVLRPVLLAERTLLVVVIDARKEGGNAPVLRFWRHGHTFRRERVRSEGPRSFTTCGRDVIDAVLADVLEIVAAAQSEPGEPQSVAREQMTAAFELLIGGDLAAAMSRTPAAAGFVEAYADARYVVEITSTRIVNYDFYDDYLSLLVSEQHGLWVDGEDFTADPDGIVRVQRVAPDTAGELVTRLFGTFA